MTPLAQFLQDGPYLIQACTWADGGRRRPIGFWCACWLSSGYHQHDISLGQLSFHLQDSKYRLVVVETEARIAPSGCHCCNRQQWTVHPTPAEESCQQSMQRSKHSRLQPVLKWFCNSPFRARSKPETQKTSQAKSNFTGSEACCASTRLPNEIMLKTPSPLILYSKFPDILQCRWRKQRQGKKRPMQRRPRHLRDAVWG